MKIPGITLPQIISLAFIIWGTALFLAGIIVYHAYPAWSVPALTVAYTGMGTAVLAFILTPLFNPEDQ